MGQGVRGERDSAQPGTKLCKVWDALMLVHSEEERARLMVLPAAAQLYVEICYGPLGWLG